MPQLDKVSYFSQYFWLVGSLSTFLYLTVKFFIPKMSRVIKLRKKLVHLVDFPFLFQESEQVRSSFDCIRAKGCHCLRDLFNQNTQQTSAWLENICQNTNKTSYQTVNKAYFRSAGEYSFVDPLLMPQTFYNKTDVRFTFFATSKF